MVDVAQNLPAFLVLIIVAAIAWYFRKQGAMLTKVRTRQLREAADLLEGHAQFLERFLDNADAPQELKDLLITFSDIMNERDAVEKLTKWATTRPFDQPVETEEMASINASVLVLRKRDQDLAEKFDAAIITAMAGPSLRWPESAALVEYAFPRLLTTPKRDAAIAVTVTRFRSGVPFSVRPPSLSLRHEEGFLIFARRSAGANRRKAPGLLLRPSHCWCASVAGPENPTPTRVRRRSRSGRRKPRNNETLDHLLSVVDPASVHAIRAPLQAIPNR